MDQSQEENLKKDENQVDDESVKLPKNTKANRWYYRHREEILEKRRLERLAKKGVDITKSESEIKVTMDELRKKKMEHLGLGESTK
jgi:hypothetical protein